MAKPQLTAEEFEAAASLSRMGDDTRAWARAVLVDGRSQAEVARSAGKNRQNVAQACVSLLRWHDHARGVEVVKLDADELEQIAAVLAKAQRRQKNKPA